MQQIDTIIIGSGAGGLAAAILLSRAGQKVLVLEQHYIPGGWCHSFKLHGSKFTPGVHYIGLMQENESSSNLYRGLGIANDLTFFKMNPQAYEHCHIGDERFDIPANFDEFLSAMIEKFPHEEKGLRRYFQTIRDVSRQLQLIPKMNSFWDKITIPWRTRHMGKYGLFSLKRVIGWHIKDPLAKAILNIQCGDHGTSPASASFPFHCAVMEHYFSGGYYPKGGGGAIVSAMIKAIKNHGGEVRTKAMVTKILLDVGDSKKAVGVELKNGEKIYASRIISNADPQKTYLDLIGRENLSLKLCNKLDITKYSCTSLILFLTIDMDVKEAGLDSGNIWVLPDSNMDELHEEMMSEDITSGDYFKGLFISCTTLKDPSSFDGKNHVLEVVTFIDYKAFEDFKDETSKRSEVYLKLKSSLMQKMINSLDRVIPNVKEHIVHKDLATPLTNEHFINSTRGSVYGTNKILNQIGPNAYRANSEIENLYLCGASILAHGVTGATFSGVHTASIILGCQQDELIVPDENQHLTIIDAESYTN